MSACKGWVLLRLSIGALVGAAACGGNDSPAGPSNQTTTTTITITSSGVSPKNIVVPRGAQVTMMNNDTRNHHMASDPHPTHTNCPELNQIGLLMPGQSRQSGNLNTAGVCGFHDHDNPGTASLQGTVTIQ
jgi:hypothetical protein